MNSKQFKQRIQYYSPFENVIKLFQSILATSGLRYSASCWFTFREKWSAVLRLQVLSSIWIVLVNFVFLLLSFNIDFSWYLAKWLRNEKLTPKQLNMAWRGLKYRRPYHVIHACLVYDSKQTGRACRPCNIKRPEKLHYERLLRVCSQLKKWSFLPLIFLQYWVFYHSV